MQKRSPKIEIGGISDVHHCYGKCTLTVQLVFLIFEANTAVKSKLDIILHIIKKLVVL